MKKNPRLAEVNCQPIRFRPGDRVLCTVYHALDPDQKKKLTRSIQKWAGEPIEVLIIDGRHMSMKIEPAPKGILH